MTSLQAARLAINETRAASDKPRKRGLRPHIENLVGQGLTSPQIAARLDCDRSYVDRVRMECRAAASINSGDRSIPAFAHHDAHIASVMSAGGFCALSERSDGRVTVVCLPLIWSQGRYE